MILKILYNLLKKSIAVKLNLNLKKKKIEGNRKNLSRWSILFFLGFG